MKNLLKSYLKRLTNLSAGNKSLMQLRLFKSQDIDIKDLDFLLKDHSSFSIIEKLISSTSAIKIAQVLDSRDASNNEASKILRSIERKNQMIYNERGVNDLYVGWPFVQGKMMDGSAIRCPLLFFSVEVYQSNNFWYIKRRQNAPISLNRSFLLAYSYYNKTPLSDDFIETSLDDFGTDSLEFRNGLYNYLKNSSLEINFNRELFENDLKHFLTYTRKDIETDTKTGELILLPHAVLGIYPQAGSYLVPDYDKLIDQTPDNATIESFFEIKDSGEVKDPLGFSLQNKLRFINKVREEHTFTPFKFDASQENALKAVKKGKSIVVQGPPGTGKSQLICNLVSDFIARGKKVLVVCQKKVALEVISQRLKEIDLDDFSVLLHDFKNDRRSIFDQIASQIDSLDDFETANNQLDTIFTERNFLKESREIDALSEELEEFKFALFDTSECGLSVKELYLNSNPKEDFIDLRSYYGDFHLHEMEMFQETIANIYPYKKKLDVWSHPFKKRLSFIDFKPSDKQTMLTFLSELPQYMRLFKNSIAQHLTAPISIEDAFWILDREQNIKELLHIISNEKAFKYFKHMLSNGQPDNDWMTIQEKLLNNLFKEDFEKTIDNKDLGNVREILGEAVASRKNFWSKWFYRIFNKDSAIIKKVLLENKLNWDKEGLKKLIALVDNRLNFQHHITAFNEKKWLPEVPLSKNKDVFSRWFETVFEALEAHQLAKELRSFKEYWGIKDITFKELQDKLTAVLNICKEVTAKHTEWNVYFSKAQLDQLVKPETIIQDYETALEQDFDNLCAYDKIQDTLKEDYKKILTKLFDHKENGTEEEIKRLFKNSISLHWIDHIETKYPILREVSSLEMDTRERKIRAAVKAKRKLSKDIVLQNVRENTFRNTEHNRLGNRTTYRDLHHQVSKQRRLWPLRKILNEFSEEVFDLIPCWLASPESVSAVFPLDFKFDLVIFDEASQCFVEKGIPALHRAKQVVITGDSMQLSPYDLYQVRYEDEQEEDSNPLLEVDSLLDVSAKFLMEVSLTGHYRSKSMDLIEFSNQHFYKRKLRMLPSKDDFLDQNKGLDYHLVDGQWHQNTNEVEANKVVELCLDYFANHPEKSVGVVTFNYKQQHLILDIITAHLLEKEETLPSNFFVKNIENVQGDERDIIIFSLAYAPTKAGKLQMNFGSLNQKGGANRLNVAVTRAKEKNIVVASILPQQMNVEDAKNQGPKLLKAFLQYSFDVSNDKFELSYPIQESQHLDWLLKHKIEAQITENYNGFNIAKNYHFADLVSTKDHDVDLFLTDDDLYFSSQGVKDSHVYLPLSLKEKGWSFTQKFSRNYWLNQTLKLPHKYLVSNK